MKFTYAYKTSDGTRHEASLNAESREAVFATLRAKGIKAIKVIAADGSKANGEVRGVRKRVLAVSVIGTALVAGALAFVAANRDAEGLAFGVTAAKPLPRQEIHGNRARIDGAAEKLFTTKAERFLARFAEPGRVFSAPESDWPSRTEFEAVLDKPLMISENEFTEHIDLKRMVEWIKREMCGYLRGGGYVSGYIRELVKRQQMEIGQREKHERRLNDLLSSASARDAGHKAQSTAYDYWLKANAQLQSTGVYPIPLPDALRGYRPTAEFEE